MIIISFIATFIIAAFFGIAAILIFIILINLPIIFLSALKNRKQKKDEVRMPDSLQAIYRRDESGDMRPIYRKNGNKN